MKPKIVDKEEERAVQKMFTIDNSMPIGMSAIGVSFFMLAVMLGVRMRRALHKAAAFASSGGHESDMSIALAPAAAGNILELSTQESTARGQLGWLQQSSKRLRPLTLCYNSAAVPSSPDPGATRRHMEATMDKIQRATKRPYARKRRKSKRKPGGYSFPLRLVTDKSFKDGDPVSYTPHASRFDNPIEPIIKGFTDMYSDVELNEMDLQSLTMSADGPVSKRSYNLLTMEQEAKLTAVAQQEKKIEKAVNDLAYVLGRQPTSEELAKRVLGDSRKVRELNMIRRQAKEAMTTMVNANFGLVMMLVPKYTKHYNADVDDLVQEGFLALIRAVEKFEPHRQLKFSTYAVNWIRSFMLNWSKYRTGSIRLPTKIKDLYKKMQTTRTELESRLGRPPTDEEMADELEVSTTRLALAVKSVRNNEVMSLDEQLRVQAGNRKATLGDILSDEQHGVSEVRSDIFGTLDEFLTPQESLIIRLRYGLTDGGVKSWDEICDDLGMTKGKARTMAGTAMRKLRYNSKLARVQALRDNMDE